ncbi:SARP family transcriptional regulator [Streptomyces hygroscopicus subsp. hygroscopicus]|uniref:AfsR/SARP family transcriptional regulator n=1 Tax=Streptomyces sp. KHY 26 TaxID=3097359 RepID=UPI0024A122BB|nr:BTAD domain-containing putative transcriptional regulator [Streptomyces hygroscopicus]GLX47278.1 SARP family transcriptional regulator [Streptomyces hygroscopicus subsp. hygroscopicus]
MSVTTTLANVPDAPPAYLSVCFLGRFATSVGGMPVERWRAGKSRSFFQYLMLHRNRVMTRDQLRDALWPEAEWHASSSSLKVACCGARSTLGASKNVEGAGSPIRLLHRDGGYLLDADDTWCDIEEFRDRVHEGMQHRSHGRADQAAESLTRAIALYHGDFLAGQDEDWIAEAREYYRSLALGALDVLRSTAMERGDSDEVVALGQRTLQIDALHEPTYQDLIRVAGLLGQPEQAMRWYQLCERRLHRLIGVEPSTDTRRTLNQVLNGRGRPLASGPRGTRTGAGRTRA